MPKLLAKTLLFLAVTLLTVETATAQLPGLTFTKQFSVTTTPLETPVNLTFTIQNLDGGAYCCLKFTDILPAGLVLSDTLFTANNCNANPATTITLTAPSTIALGGAGATVAVGAPNACVITVHVKGTTTGNKQNVAVLDTGTNGQLDILATSNLLVVEPDLTVTKTHVGNFSQGQLGATYTIVVTNSAAGVGAGPTSGTVTLADTLPVGLTATAIAGAGWTCTLATLTCTNASVMVPGESFPPITLTVNVATNAPAVVVNSVAVSGGGEVLAATKANNTAVDTATVTAVDFFQIRYAANLTSGDSVINITNTGANGASLTGPGFGGAVGNICVNVYTFSPDEQLVSCCSCAITPNGLVSLSVNNDLVSNTLTGVRPNSVVVKLVNTGAGAAFTGTSCTNSAALAGTAAFPLAGGFQGFGTTLHTAATSGMALTESPFVRSTLSPAELASITNRCTNIIGNGSTFGICRSCRAGGLNASN